MPAMAIVVGIDLASSPEYGAVRYNRLGFASLDDALTVTAKAGRLSDAEIDDFIASQSPVLIAIDSPLSLPAGRCCADEGCDCARFGIVRAVDRELARRHFHPYWPLLRSMRPVTLRGIALRRQYEAMGIPVIEVFPGAAQDALGISRKQRGLDALLSGLRSLGITGDLPARDGDALDAVTAAFVGWLHLRGRTEAIGPPTEVQVIVPSVAPIQVG